MGTGRTGAPASGPRTESRETTAPTGARTRKTPSSPVLARANRPCGPSETRTQTSAPASGRIEAESVTFPSTRASGARARSACGQASASTGATAAKGPPSRRAATRSVSAGTGPSRNPPSASVREEPTGVLSTILHARTSTPAAGLPSGPVTRPSTTVAGGRRTRTSTGTACRPRNTRPEGTPPSPRASTRRSDRGAIPSRATPSASARARRIGSSSSLGTDPGNGNPKRRWSWNFASE